MNRAYLLAVIVLGLVLIAPIPDPGHPAEEIGPGTFAPGNFVFPNDLTIQGNFLINESALFVNASSGRVGIGTLTPEYALDINGTTRITRTHSSGSGTFMIGQEIVTRIQGGSLNDIIGSSAAAEVTAGSVEILSGHFTGYLLLGGDVDSAIGLQIAKGRAGGSVINETGIKIRSINIGVDPATNRRAIWIQEPTGEATNDYGIYQEGTQTNYFEGNINATGGISTPEICLGGVCQGTWPTGGESLWTNSSGNATFTAGNIGIGTVEPTARLEIDGGLRLNTTLARPTCDADQRGTFWVEQRGVGDDDYVWACLRNSTQHHNWILMARGE